MIYAHPEAPSSRANRAIRGGAQGILAASSLQVTWYDLYHHYPDFHVNVKAEQQRLLAHDVIIFQHPFHWYSVPGLLKQWIDEVLADGWAYGGGAQALAGKPWGHWVTAGGSAGAYQMGGQNNFSVQELMRPLEQTARLCGCLWQPPQFTFSSLTLDETDLANEAKRYAAWLQAFSAVSTQILEAHQNA